MGRRVVLRAIGVHEARLWQACNWYDGENYAFHERTYFPWSPFKEVHSEYWLNGHSETKKEMEEKITEMGLDIKRYHVLEEFYGEGFFPACREFEDAEAFYNKTKGQVKNERVR